MESQSCQETVRKKGVYPDARNAKVASTGRHYCELVDQVIQHAHRQPEHAYEIRGRPVRRIWRIISGFSA